VLVLHVQAAKLELLGPKVAPDPSKVVDQFARACLRGQCALEIIARACLRGHRALEITARTCLRGHCALEITARASLRGHCALEITARACLRGHCALEITALACLRGRCALLEPCVDDSVRSKLPSEFTGLGRTDLCSTTLCSAFSRAWNTRVHISMYKYMYIIRLLFGSSVTATASFASSAESYDLSSTCRSPQL
jgi:hypothetical protein